MFLETVEGGGREVPRFEFVEGYDPAEDTDLYQ